MAKRGNFSQPVKRVVLLLVAMIAAALSDTAYPSLYGGIGTPLFQAADGYRQLLDNDHFEASKEAMKRYIGEADKLKSEGMGLDRTSAKSERKAYIESLRKLQNRGKKIDHDLLQTIRVMKAQKLHAELTALQTSPYPLIRQSSMVEQEKMRSAQEASKQKSYDALQRSLLVLRSELEEAREKRAEGVACLNDITAINYLMLKVEEFKRERAWCRAYESSAQISEFEYGARKNCGKEDPRYLEWSSASTAYRTEMKEVFKEACRP